MTLVGVLLATLVIGCAGETEFVKPTCSPAVRPVLPETSRAEVWDALIAGAGEERGKDLFHGISLTILRVIEWAEANEAIVREVCDPPPE